MPQPTEFAGFTKEEWIAALSRIMSHDSASHTATQLFTQIAAAGSNGYGLDTETWALLAFASERGEERVAELMRHYPEEFRRAVWLRLEEEKRRQS